MNKDSLLKVENEFLHANKNNPIKFNIGYEL